MLKKYLVYLLLISTPSISLALEAKTEDGRKVKLKDDGSWTFISETINKPSNENHFRGVKWGASLNEIKKSEDSDPALEQDGALIYEDTLNGLAVAVIYNTTQNKLVRAKYFVEEPHTNRNEYLSDFSQLEKLLKEKYGKPDKAETFWKKDLYKDDYDKWGFAVSLGHLSKFTFWETADTSITLALSGDNYKINLEIEYRSENLKGIESEKKNKELRSKL